MFCGNCGKILDDGTVLCPYCGAVAADGSQPEFGMDMPEITKPSVGADILGIPYSADMIDSISDDVSKSSEITLSKEDSGNDASDKEDARNDINADGIHATVLRPEKSRRKPLCMALTALVCVLFSALTLAFALSSAALWTVRDVLQNGSISEASAQVNPIYLKAKSVIKDPHALEEALASSGIADVEIGEIGEDETIGDLIERTLPEYGFTEEKAEQFFEKSEVIPYLTEVVAAYENFLLTGEDTKPVTDEKLKETTLKCMNYASKELGIKFRPDSEQRLDELFKENKDNIRAANPSEAMGAGGSYIRYCFSLPVMIIASVLTLVMAMLAGIITGRPDAAFITLGIPALLSGCLFLYVGLFPKLALERANIPSAAIGDSLEVLGSGSIKAGTVEAVIGLVFVVAFIVYRAAASRIAKKKALQSAQIGKSAA